jgi:hypothetical protein
MALPHITIGSCSDSHQRIGSVFQKPGFLHVPLKNAISPGTFFEPLPQGLQTPDSPVTLGHRRGSFFAQR